MKINKIGYNTGMRCPQKGCNAPARLLFSLVCANPSCRNYDESWYSEVYSKPLYRNDSMGEYVFLGLFLHESQRYDLYYSVNPLDGSEWVEARFGDDFDACLMEELSSSENSNSCVIREAASRWKTIKRIEVP